MTQAGCFQSFQVCAVRVTRLDATGTPLTGVGETNGYIAKAPIEAKMSPDNQAGVELTAENGCGTLCGYYKQPDQLKKYNVSLSLCDLDLELIELLTDNPIVTVGGETVGQTSKRVGACSNNIRNGVALELWSKKWNSCAPPTGDELYWHWYWPRAYLQTGDQEMKNDFMVIPIEGYLQENPNFGHGGWTEAPWPALDPLDALWGVVSDSFFPEAACGYQPVT
jgi:hypothetical protein